jgi:hypothetical protein
MEFLEYLFRFPWGYPDPAVLHFKAHLVGAGEGAQGDAPVVGAANNCEAGARDCDCPSRSSSLCSWNYRLHLFWENKAAASDVAVRKFQLEIGADTGDLSYYYNTEKN